jgi:hypothetical protein
MNEFSERLKRFIEGSSWIFAKTYAQTWPHEYIVEENVDSVLFNELAKHIDNFGYESDFYSTKQTYFDHEGNTYWHMGNIINRCPESETFRRRKAEGRLPEDAKK